MLAFLRRLKFSYMLYNFFHKKQLIHNNAYYNSFGINKKYYSPVSSADFKNVKNKSAFADTPEEVKQRLHASTAFQNLTQGNKNSLENFSETGFAVLKIISVMK